MLRFRQLLILIILQGIVFNGVSSVSAARLVCGNSPVIFESKNLGDYKCVCDATKAAITFLESIGLSSHDCITITLVEQMPTQHDHILIGQFYSHSHEVSLLTYQKSVDLSLSNKPIFGIEMSEDLWCSCAAHELAHVISDQHLNPNIKAHTAGEYIAAVTQLSVLPVKIRDAILTKYQDIKAYQSREEMSELYFLLDPNRFAVKCYLHFISLENPKEFINLLLKEGNGY